ncbi:MAG: zinc-binding dehydrogenase [Alphaproteobacteria bacterium]|nr:zinc-binding dehydrogenase [Alphaproteobacteria bacterium]
MAEGLLAYDETDVFADDERWDVVLDTVGRASVAAVRGLATPTGRIGLVAAGLPQMLAGVWANLTSRQRVVFGVSDENPDYTRRLVQWLEQGALRPVVDVVLPWERGAEAHARVDTHRKRGSVVLTFASPNG